MALPQAAGHVGADAGAAKAQVFVGVQQGFDVEFVAQGGLHHRAFVGLTLVRHRPRARPLRLDAAVRRQPLHGADGALEQQPVALRALLGLAPGGFGGGPRRGGLRGALGHRLLNLPQVGQCSHFHGSADCPASPASVAGAPAQARFRSARARPSRCSPRA